ncbi:MAG: hypothetical protein ACUVWN_04640 [bacterium]
MKDRMRVGNGDPTVKACTGCPTAVPQHPKPSFTRSDTSLARQDEKGREYPDTAFEKKQPRRVAIANKWSRKKKEKSR